MLSDFDKNFPDSLLMRDVHLSYATALLREGRAQEAATLLEKDRTPVRSDVELAVGRAYQTLGLRPFAMSITTFPSALSRTPPEPNCASSRYRAARRSVGRVPTFCSKRGTIATPPTNTAIC